jgi:hypothetical protein
VESSTASSSSRGDGGYALREELKLDGTHMHPRYVGLLEASLGRCAGGQTGTMKS